MYYYYKIQNIINNDLYIGITINPTRRKRDHFRHLRNNEHNNPYLQNAFNKYGEENFIFEIIDTLDTINDEIGYKYEAELIKKYDSFNNGYNCNAGGEHCGPRSHFTKEQVFYIRSAYYFNEWVAGLKLSKYYNVNRSTIDGIRTARYNKI